MEKTIELGTKSVKFCINAATTYLYRQKFRKDLVRTFQRLSEEPENDETFEALSQLAYIAAKQADKTIPDDPSEWLAGFGLNDFITKIVPAVSELWQESIRTVSEPKK